MHTNNPLKRDLMQIIFNYQKICGILLLFLPFLSYAQEGMPVYSDYLTDNYYLIHPSMAGAADCGQIRLTARKNWFGQKEAPGLQTLGINKKVGEQSAIGALLFNDQNGFHSQSGAYVTYAHHIMFSRSELDLNMLSFGIQPGILQYRIDQTDFIPNGDPLIFGGSRSTVEFNLDLGFSYHYHDFYTHVTIKNLLKNSGVNNDIQITDNLRRYLVSFGYVISKPGKDLSFEPSLMVQHQTGTNQSTIDFNLKAYKEIKSGTFFGGISFRRSLDGAEFLENSEIRSQKLNYFTPFFGINFNKFLVSYTYTHQLNDVVFNPTGLHQITLGLDFSCRKKRYDCNCPAIN